MANQYNMSFYENIANACICLSVVHGRAKDWKPTLGHFSPSCTAVGLCLPKLHQICLPNLFLKFSFLRVLALLCPYSS